MDSLINKIGLERDLSALLLKALINSLAVCRRDVLMYLHYNGVFIPDLCCQPHASKIGEYNPIKLNPLIEEFLSSR